MVVFPNGCFEILKCIFNHKSSLPPIQSLFTYFNALTCSGISAQNMELCFEGVSLNVLSESCKHNILTLFYSFVAVQHISDHKLWLLILLKLYSKKCMHHGFCGKVISRCDYWKKEDSFHALKKVPAQSWLLLILN